MHNQDLIQEYKKRIRLVENDQSVCFDDLMFNYRESKYLYLNQAIYDLQDQFVANVPDNY